MPKENDQDRMPLIEQTEQTPSESYQSIKMGVANSINSSTSQHFSSNQPCDARSYFFTQQFKKDFNINDFSGSLNVFKF